MPQNVNFIMPEPNQFQEPGLVYRFFTAPWIWAGAMTWGLYQGLPHLPVGKDLAIRYFCGHPLERVLAGLFFVGFAIILIKAVTMIFERRAFRKVTTFGISNPSDELEENVARFQSHLTSTSQSLENTQWGRRLEHLLAFFKGRRNGDGLGEHLVYLSESAMDRLQASHALLQTVIWSIPILGFLGTVMGITLAIANVTPEQLDTSLDAVTGGLAVAFDTTALALSLSLVLGFASLFVKRAEEGLLTDIDERCRLEVNRCFPIGVTGDRSHPLFDAETKAAEDLLKQTAELISAQTETWSSALDELRQNWVSTLEQQQAHLSGSLSDGTETALSNHAQQLAEYRDQFLNAQKSLSEQLSKNLSGINDDRQASEAVLLERLNTLSSQIQQSAEEAATKQHRDLARTLDEFGTRVESWQSKTDSWQRQLEQLTLAMTRQSAALLEHGGQLERIVGQEEQLVRLQTQLDRNLEVVRTGETFEQTLHNLTAAVHLLTARARTRDAA